MQLCILWDRDMCHSSPKLIGDEEDTLKFFIAFDIMPRGPIFRVVVESQIVVSQQSLPHNDTPVTRTHDLDFDTICRTLNCEIPPQNQLVMRKTRSNFLWHLTSRQAVLFLE